ncbi:hypothetical protein KKF34_05340 [Myxococcota bacterium]|nr:hypothetical protein [Myxococcota bacterium]MBU1380126.1 hypothetical protein [Myxococcota bacterium]MBU1496284.1 hypothetical protein [Myxococcota bacterium]
MTDISYLSVIGIKSVSKSGAMQPLLCTLENGKDYYVKYFDTAAGADLYNELICCELAKLYKLNIPDYKIAMFDQNNIKFFNLTNKVKIDIIPCFGFASEYQESYSLIKNIQIPKISDDIKMKVFLFDWWIKNSDRKKDTNQKFNSNFLFQYPDSYFLIDHNNAFSFSFKENDFLETHIFSDIKDKITADFLAEQKVILKSIATESKITDILDKIPIEWDFGKNQNLSYDTKDKICELLNRVDKGFWHE